MENNKRKTTVKAGAGAVISGEKAKDLKKVMITLIKYLKPYRLPLTFVFLFAITGTVFTILSPSILGDATDVIVKGLMRGNIDFARLREILIFLAILYALSFIFTFSQGLIMAKVSQKVTYHLRKSMSEKVHRLPLSYFDKTPYGEVQSRITNDIETINQALSQSITQMITSIATLIGILVMMLRISLIMTLIAAIALPLSMISIRFVVKKSQKYFSTQQSSLGELNSHVQEMYTGHTIIKAFGREKSSTETFDQINGKLYHSAWKSQFLSGLMMPITIFVGNLSYVVICIVGGFLAIQGTLSIGNIQAFIQYIRSFNQPVAQVANIANLLQSIGAASERIFELLEETEEDNQGILTQNNNIPLKGQVSFENIAFGYDPQKPILKDFTFHSQPGNRIAIVGPTGAGKTTLIKLLLRYYEKDSGSISIDGKEITQYTRKELHQFFGVVLQETWLFSGTIAENIAYGKPNASMQEIKKASYDAHMDHFIRTLPEGYDLKINENATNISQGQKQLLTIARALLADKPILILDEATSSVDTRTEKQIQEAMATLMKGRTSFIIAHRLSTIKDADWILVMDQGNIIEQGTHHSLLSDGGFYSSLYQSQFA